MFGDEPACGFSHPLRTPVPQNTDQPAFFDAGNLHGPGEPHPNLFPDPVFDPSATVAYDFDLSNPFGEDGEEKGIQGPPRADMVPPSPEAFKPDNQPEEGSVGDPKSSDTSQQAIIDLKNPDEPFAPGSARPRFPFPHVLSNGPPSSPPKGPPSGLRSDDSLLQRSLFAPCSEAVVDLRDPSNVHAFEGPVKPPELWYQQPVVWLVGGLFLVAVFFAALLLQDLKAPESPSPVSPQPVEQTR